MQWCYWLLLLVVVVGLVLASRCNSAIQASEIMHWEKLMMDISTQLGRVSLAITRKLHRLSGILKCPQRKTQLDQSGFNYLMNSKCVKIDRQACLGAWEREVLWRVSHAFHDRAEGSSPPTQPHPHVPRLTYLGLTSIISFHPQNSSKN